MYLLIFLSKDSIAYVPQEAWIRNETMQKNILFGNDMKKMRYDLVLDACALSLDIEMLPAGDHTEIGEKVYHILWHYISM